MVRSAFIDVEAQKQTMNSINVMKRFLKFSAV